MHTYDEKTGKCIRIQKLKKWPKMDFIEKYPWGILSKRYTWNFIPTRQLEVGETTYLSFIEERNKSAAQNDNLLILIIPDPRGI